MPKSPKTASAKSSRPSKSHKSPKTSKTSKKKEENNDVIFIDPQKENEQKNEQKKPKQPNLTNFFKPLEKPAPPPTLPQCMPDTSRFTSLFQLKQGMTIAPILARKPLSTEERENLLNVHCEFPDYLSQCKNKRVKIPATVTNKLKAKYHDFHDNYRPAYYGTWRRRSKAINGRRPFSKGEKTLNYEYDSDDDWEEEPADADECKSDEEEEKDVPMDSDEEDDGFFVDHGYLSSDEGSQGGDDLDENCDVEGEPKRPMKISNDDKNEGNQTEKRKSSGNEKEHEQRRQRLEQKAEEYKAEIKRKERLFKKRQLIPTVYLPDESVHPEFSRFVLPGVRFDYSKIVAKSVENDDEKIEKMSVETVTVE